MTLTADQISQMKARELFRHLLPFMPESDWVQMEARGYECSPSPVQWHATLNGNVADSVDLTVGDCGNEIRGAAFVRALMYHAGQQSVFLAVGLGTAGGYDDEGEWREPNYYASAKCNRTYARTACNGDTPELALLRAYLTVKAGCV